MDTEEIYSTDYSGESKWINGRLVFTKQPDYMGIKVGDEVPKNWRISPKNGTTLKLIEAAIPDNRPLEDSDIDFK